MMVLRGCDSRNSNNFYVAKFLFFSHYLQLIAVVVVEFKKNPQTIGKKVFISSLFQQSGKPFAHACKWCALKHQLDENKYFMCAPWWRQKTIENEWLNLYDVVMNVTEWKWFVETIHSSKRDHFEQQYELSDLVRSQFRIREVKWKRKIVCVCVVRERGR